MGKPEVENLFKDYLILRELNHLLEEGGINQREGER
jgi:hypothetical protein